MAHGVVCHFDLPHMAQKVADWTRREGRPRADEMAHGAVCRFELPHVAENNRRVTRVDSSLWPQRTVPKLPSGTNGCQTLKTATLNTSYFCQKRPLCQPPPSPTPPPNSHFVRKVKLRLAYRLAFVKCWSTTICATLLANTFMSYEDQVQYSYCPQIVIDLIKGKCMPVQWTTTKWVIDNAGSFQWLSNVYRHPSCVNMCQTMIPRWFS